MIRAQVKAGPGQRAQSNIHPWLGFPRCCTQRVWPGSQEALLLAWQGPEHPHGAQTLHPKVDVWESHLLCLLGIS